jgi:hypothetical protein
MDGQSRVKRPLEVRREFAGCRLEARVLVRAYELVVPVARRQVKTAAAVSGVNAAANDWLRTGRVALGA